MEHNVSFLHSPWKHEATILGQKYLVLQMKCLLLRYNRLQIDCRNWHLALSPMFQYERGWNERAGWYKRMCVCAQCGLSKLAVEPLEGAAIQFGTCSENFVRDCTFSFKLLFFFRYFQCGTNVCFLSWIMPEINFFFHLIAQISVHFLYGHPFENRMLWGYLSEIQF